MARFGYIDGWVNNAGSANAADVGPLLGMTEANWDAVLAKLSPLPVVDGKYTALESHPDTWTNLDSRHDHPEMLMALGFFSPGADVDRAVMDRTVSGLAGMISTCWRAMAAFGRDIFAPALAM